MFQHMRRVVSTEISPCALGRAKRACSILVTHATPRPLVGRYFLDSPLGRVVPRRGEGDRAGTSPRFGSTLLENEGASPFSPITRLLIVAVLVLFSAISHTTVHAQSGLRESLERLDVNKNGSIEPDEVTPLARPYLERITKVRRMSLDRSNDIHRLQEAARVYYALQNGVSGDQVQAEPENSIKPFEPANDQELIPQFGLAEIKFPYTQDDLDFADRTLGDYDRDGDGYITRAEALKARRWTHRNPFDDDMNKDDRLSRMELTQRYARRRLLDDASDELRQKAWRTGGEARPSQQQEQRRDDSQWWRDGGSGYWLTASILGRFDLNRNGRLEVQEMQSLGIPTALIDADRDGDLTREELHGFLRGLQEEAGDFTDGLPGWFYELDANRDSQVSMAEFATQWSEDKLQEFASLDSNTDGLLTALEVVKSKAMVGGSYTNQSAEVLPPRKTIVSEIEIDEDFVIGDLNLQLSITHSQTSQLDAYLTGPDGQRIELFTEVGGSGDHFDETIFDDQSRYPITKARPPFKGTFLPEGLLNRQPGLSHFTGKQARGVWQLSIRATRSDRFGMLHNWSLIARPREELLTSISEPPQFDGPQPNAAREAQPAPRQSDSESRKPEPKRDAAADWARSLSREDIERLPPEKRAYVEKVKGEGKNDNNDERRKAIERYKEWVQSQKSQGGKKPSKEDKNEFRDKDRSKPSSK